MIYDALGAVNIPLDLGNPEVLRDVKFLMLMLEPSLVKDPTWLTSGWSRSASDIYKKIWKEKLGSGHGSIAHTENGVAKLGLKENVFDYYPSIYGVNAMGAKVLASGDMTQQQLQDAAPALTAYGKATHGQMPVGAGVTPPRESLSVKSSGGGAGWLVGGLVVAGVLATVFWRE